jgi:hypothetical protein
VPAPFWVKAPDPLITPESVLVPDAIVVSKPLFVTLFEKMPPSAGSADISFSSG